MEFRSKSERRNYGILLLSRRIVIKKRERADLISAAERGNVASAFDFYYEEAFDKKRP